MLFPLHHIPEQRFGSVTERSWPIDLSQVSYRIRAAKDDQTGVISKTLKAVEQRGPWA
jgi:hypothetical protein